MTAEQERIREASNAIYEEAKEPPFITDMEGALENYQQIADAYNANRDREGVPSFAELAQQYNPTQREMNLMSEKEANEYIQQTLQIMRDDAVNNNKIVEFTIEDRDGNLHKWEIKPATLSTAPENLVPDGDDKANFWETDMKTGVKTQRHKDDMKRSVNFSQELKRYAARSVIQAPAKAKEKLKKEVNEGLHDAIANVGR